MTKGGPQSVVGEQVTQFEEGKHPEDLALKTTAESGDRTYLAGDIIADRYRLERKLGEGGMGVVWVAHSLVLDVDVALKLIRASAAGGGVASRMAREAHAAAKVAHPALVRVFDFGWTNHGDPFLVMELAQGETLDSVLDRESRVGAIRAVQILLPLADGLRCAHEKGVIHRDVKPENVFLAADPFGRVQPKLLDFGIAKTEHQPKDSRLTRAGAVLGSPEFMSPEQARGQLDVDERTDVWSMCVMLYEMITGVLPFQQENYNALMQAILLDDPVPAHRLEGGDEGLWQVISRGLEKDPDNRWSSMTELGEALALWLYEHGVKEDVSGNSVRALWLDGTISGIQWAPITTIPPGPANGVMSASVLRHATAESRTRRHRAAGVDASSRKSLLARPYAVLAAASIAGVLGVALTLATTSKSTHEALGSSTGASHAVETGAALRYMRGDAAKRAAASADRALAGSFRTPVDAVPASPSGSEPDPEVVRDAGATPASSGAAANASKSQLRAARRPSRQGSSKAKVRDFGF